MRTAYLNIILKKSTREMVGVGIYSDPGRAVTNDSYCYAELYSASGNTFQEARDALKTDVKNSPWWAWLGEWRDKL